MGLEDFSDLSPSEAREKLGALLLTLLAKDRVVVFAQRKDGVIVAIPPTLGLVNDLALVSSLLDIWKEDSIEELLSNRRREYGHSDPTSG